MSSQYDRVVLRISELLDKSSISYIHSYVPIYRSSFIIEWVRRGESSGSSSATDGMRGGRRSEQIIGNNTRIYDHRLVTGQHEGQPTRALFIYSSVYSLIYQYFCLSLVYC